MWKYNKEVKLLFFTYWWLSSPQDKVREGACCRKPCYLVLSLFKMTRFWQWWCWFLQVWGRFGIESSKWCCNIFWRKIYKYDINNIWGSKCQDGSIIEQFVGATWVNIWLASTVHCRNHGIELAFKNVIERSGLLNQAWD